MAEKPLDRDLEAEVLIIGMGISGGMTGDLLTEAGHDVVMIDRRGSAKGSTPASKALVQFEIDVLFGEFRSKIGTAKADQAWRRSRLSVTNLRDRVIDLGLECRMVPRSTLYLASNPLTGTAVRREAEAQAATGLSARYLTAGQLREQFGIPSGHARSFGHDQTVYDLWHYVRVLARKPGAWRNRDAL